MTDTTTWSDIVLGALLTYGPLALGLSLLLSSTGIPVPGTILIVAAGAFGRQEMMNAQAAFLAGVLGAVLGDNIAYGIGRLTGTWAEHRFGRNPAWQSAVEQVNKRGAWTIFLTRWLITPIGGLVSIIAGVSRFGWHQFLFIDVGGEILWVLLYWSIGWLLGSQWHVASTFLSDFSGLILGVSLLVVALVIGVRSLLKRRNAQESPEGAEQVNVPEEAPLLL